MNRSAINENRSLESTINEISLKVDLKRSAINENRSTIHEKLPLVLYT